MHFFEYPFQPKRIEIRPGIAMSYLDEGPRDAAVIVMLHGNPSWSYYWRRLVDAVSRQFRCIVPDHIGMGLSDKPIDSVYRYTVESRVNDLTALLAHLDVQGPVILAVHDWGGMIGFAWALSHVSQVAGLIITNTAGFPLPPNKRAPWFIQLGRQWALGEWCVRRLNAFARAVARWGVRTPMLPAIRQAYLAPYGDWDQRIGIARFMQDIPYGPKDESWHIVHSVDVHLAKLADRPTLIGWGLLDPVFDRQFFECFCQRFPNATVCAYPDAGHYILEDEATDLIARIERFLQQFSPV